MSFQNTNILEESDPFYETNSMFINQDKWKLFDGIFFFSNNNIIVKQHMN